MSKPSNKIGKNRTKPNYFYSIISVALVLFLLGFFGLVLFEGRQIIKFAKEKVEIIVELKNDLEQSEIDKLKREIGKENFTKPGSVKYTSKEDGAEMMKNEFGEDFLKLDLPNPLYDILTFNVKSDFMTSGKLVSIKNQLKNEAIVSDVFYQESLVNAIAQNIEKLSFYALMTGFFFIIVAITLIHNTVKLALYSNRFLIKNMELVGASWKFISRPYLINGIKHGLISGLISIGLLTGLLVLAYREIPELNEMNPSGYIIILFLILLVLGIIITTLSTYYVVNKYLKMRVEEMY